MIQKRLGKITKAQFGRYPDRPFLFGLQLEFGFKGSGVGCGGKYTVNISDNCRWERQEKLEAIDRAISHLNKILEDANVNYVSELIGRPVEVTLEDSMFKDFRIFSPKAFSFTSWVKLFTTL